MVIGALATDPRPPTANTLWGKSSVPVGMVIVTEVLPSRAALPGVPESTGPVALSRWKVMLSRATNELSVPLSVAGNDEMVGFEIVSVALLVTWAALWPLWVPVQEPRSGVTV